MDQPPADITAFLQGVAPFSTLDVSEVEPIAARLRISYHPEGGEIGAFDPPGEDGLYIIRKGAVKLVDPENRMLERRGEGEIFGHRIGFSGEASSYRVYAIEDSLVWHLPAAALAKLVARSEAIATFLQAGHGARLRQHAAGRSTASRLAELALREPVTAAPDDDLATCARRMAERNVSCLPIVGDGRLLGIITDRDLRARVVARRIAADAPVADIMTENPSTIGLEARVEDALVEMMRMGIHHLPVTNAEGRLAAVISSGDLLAVQSPNPLRLVRDIHRARGTDRLTALARQGPQMLAGLVKGGAGATELGRIAGRITDACTRRLIELATDELGPAPMEFAWLAFGSQGRLEQGLTSDQDNGLLLAEAPDAETAEYFERLGEFVCDGLNECGYVYCPGGVMAKGEWCMPFDGWRRRFDRWIREPEPKSVMQSSIFFDMRAVAGKIELAERLHREVLEQARDREIFRRFLAAESMKRRPPIGLFRQFVQERGGEHSQGLNLKQRGVIPIVDLARVRALEGAIQVIHTEQRIEAAADAGIVTAGDADDLIHALRFINDIRLKHQSRQLEAGDKPDHLVDPSELSGLHRRYLRSAFGIVTEAQSALAQRYLL